MIEKENIILQNVKDIMLIVADLLKKSGRTQNSVQIMGVSKTYSLSNIEIAHQAGLFLFGESRMQEIADKFNNPAAIAIREKIELHYIGTLQSNKVKKALDFCDCIESVDSLKLIELLEKQLEHQISNRYDFEVGDRLGDTARSPRSPRDSLQGVNKKFPIFLQIRSSDFDYKHGFDKYNILQKAVEKVVASKFLDIKGFMTIAPFSTEEATVRKAFEHTRKWRDKISTEFSLAHLQLSMGMSADFKIAIEEGSNIIRIGSAIFGKRK